MTNHIQKKLKNSLLIIYGHGLIVHHQLQILNKFIH